MAVLIDSSVLIEAERRRLTLNDVVELLSDEDTLAMSAMTVAELLFGVHLAAPGRQGTEREAFISAIVTRIPTVPFDLRVARVYAEIWAVLRREGNLIAPHDLLIGSTALAHDFDVLTYNIRDFERIPNLSVRQPAW